MNLNGPPAIHRAWQFGVFQKARGGGIGIRKIERVHESCPGLQIAEALRWEGGIKGPSMM